MRDGGAVPTTANREVGNSDWLRWGVHTRHAGQRRRVCQWLRDQLRAQPRERPTPGHGRAGAAKVRDPQGVAGWLRKPAILLPRERLTCVPSMFDSLGVQVPCTT
jgi:hypothetical protein